MELKHFSHNHALAFHQVPRGSQIHCSACKSPGSGDVYACWQCNYFLHQHCFRATRSLNHPSHPLHPLTLVPSPTYPSGSFICNSCNLGGDGLSYSCSACEFDIHVHCALIPIPNPQTSPAHNFNSQPQTPINAFVPFYPQPNITTPPSLRSSNPKSETSMIKHFGHPHFLKPKEIKQTKKKIACSACESDLSGSAYSCTEPHCNFNLHKACFDLPREVRHKFHPHPLTLLAALPPIYGDEYRCDACHKVGKGFVYNCAICSFDLHINCFRLPETVTRPDDDHPLILSAPVSEGFMCDVCKNIVDEKAWLYNCSECDFGTHLECVYSEVRREQEEEKGDFTDQLLKLKQQEMQNFIQYKKDQLSNQFISMKIANSVIEFDPYMSQEHRYQHQWRI